MIKNEGIVANAVGRAYHGDVLINSTNVIGEVRTVVDYRGSFGGIPHEVRNDAKSLLGNDLTGECVLIEVLAAGRKVLCAEPVVVIVLLLKDGCLEACEGYHSKLVTAVEGLVTYGFEGCGKHYVSDLRADEGLCRDSHGSLGNGYHHLVACVGDKLKAVGHYSVEEAVDDLDGIADIVGAGNRGKFLAVKGLGSDGLECRKLTHREGVVTDVDELLTEGDGEGSHYLLHKCEVTDLDGAAKVCRHERGICKGIATDLADVGKVNYLGELLTVGECALAEGDLLVAEDDLGKISVIYECVLGYALGGGKIYLGKRRLTECAVADGLDAGEIDVSELRTVVEATLRNLGDSIAELDRGQLAAELECRNADILCRGEIYRNECGSVVSVHVLSVLIDVDLAHIQVAELVENVAGECAGADALCLREVDILESRSIEECVIADHSTCTESYRLELGGTHKCAVADGNVLTDGEFVKRRGVDVIVDLESVSTEIIAVILAEVGLSVESECVLLDLNVVADGNRRQGLTLSECPLADSHTVGNCKRCNVGVRECVCADPIQLVKSGNLSYRGSVERVVTDIGKRAESDALELLAICECIVGNRGDAGNSYLGNTAVVARERARTDSGDLGIVDCELAANTGSDVKYGIACLIGEISAILRCNEGGVLLVHDEGGSRTVTECILADYGNVGTEGDLLKGGTLVEGGGRNNRGVNGDLLKCGTTVKCVLTELDNGSLDGHLLHCGVAAEGVSADRLKACAEGDALELLVSREGTVCYSNDAIEGYIASESTALEGASVNELDVLESHYRGKRGTSVECTEVDPLKSRGKNDLGKCGKICKGVGVDGLHALGNNNGLDGVLTDEPLLGRGGIVLGDLIVRALIDVVVVGERELSYIGDAESLGYLYHAAVTEVMSERGTCGNIGILDLDADGLRVVGALAVHNDVDVDRGEAFGLSRDHPLAVHLLYLDEIIVAGYGNNVGDVGIELGEAVTESYRLGGIHRQCVSAGELHLVAGATEISLLGGEEVEGLVG